MIVMAIYLSEVLFEIFDISSLGPDGWYVYVRYP